MKVYRLYDSKAAIYGRVFEALNDALAGRMFEEIINDDNTSPGRYPHDFTLWHVGETDETTGALVPCTPHEIARGLDYKPMGPKEVENVG